MLVDIDDQTTGIYNKTLWLGFAKYMKPLPAPFVAWEGDTDMKNHGLWMIICCVLPLLLIFIVPAFGAKGGGPLFIALLVCFALHMFMMRGRHGNHDNKKEGGHGTH